MAAHTMDLCKLQLMATAIALPRPIPARAASVLTRSKVHSAGDRLELLDAFLEVGNLNARRAER